jgi:hypothetical protein
MFKYKVVPYESIRAFSADLSEHARLGWRLHTVIPHGQWNLAYLATYEMAVDNQGVSTHNMLNEENDTPTLTH